MKKVLTALVLTAMMIFPAAALAQNGGPMSSEDMAAYDALWQEHRQAMAAIQDKLWAKSMEYEALADNPNSKPADISALVNEMAQLRAQMRAEGDNFNNQLETKGFGPGRGYSFGPGYDRGMCWGYGGGRGPRGGMGYGRGFGGGYDRDYDRDYGRGYGRGRHYGRSYHPNW